MTRLLLLGATGRTGAAILDALPAGVDVTAAVREPTDSNRLANTAAAVSNAVIDISDVDSLRGAMGGIDVVVNAIRLRDDIAPTELIALHERIREAGNSVQNGTPRIVTVGGAGALRLRGTRFWHRPEFPQTTLPRGRAHAALRDHLEFGSSGDTWTYLIPPPTYDPDGPRTGHWELTTPAKNEADFTARAISYADFGIATAAVATGQTTGTRLIAWPRLARQI